MLRRFVWLPSIVLAGLVHAACLIARTTFALPFPIATRWVIITVRVDSTAMAIPLSLPYLISLSFSHHITYCRNFRLFPSPAFAPEEIQGKNLTSQLRWWSTKDFFNLPNEVFRHDIYFIVDGYPLGRLQFNSTGYQTHCHMTYEWCVTQGYPLILDLHIWYKGYTYGQARATYNCGDVRYEFCRLYIDFQNPA